MVQSHENLKNVRLLIIIVIKLLQDKDPMEQSDSRHSTIAAFHLDPFEVQMKYLYGFYT